jgi:hypothetical protein
LGDSTTAGQPQFLSPLEAPPAGRENPESQYAYWMMRIEELTVSGLMRYWLGWTEMLFARDLITS